MKPKNFNPQIVVPRGSIWTSNWTLKSSIEKKFGIFMVDDGGVLLVKISSDFLQNLKTENKENLKIRAIPEDNMIHFKRGKKTMNMLHLLRFMTSKSLQSLLEGSIFFPKEEKVKFWENENGTLKVDPVLLLDCIWETYNTIEPQYTEKYWEEILGAFLFVTHPEINTRHKYTHENTGVEVCAKTKGKLEIYTTISAEKFPRVVEEVVIKNAKRDTVLGIA